MSSKLPKSALNLKQFLLRQEVIRLYKDIFRAIKQVPDQNTKNSLQEWARSDFRNNKNLTDDAAIKSMIHHGRKSLKDLQQSLALSKGS